VKLARNISEAIDVDKKIDYRDDFELVMMRWKYFLKSPNPSAERLRDFKPLVEKISKEMYNKFSHVFGISGMELDDVLNIARCHAVNFAGVFSIEEADGVPNKPELDKLVRRYRKKNGRDSYPTEKDIRNKNMYNFSKFLAQRLEEVGKIVFQKNRSIRGTGEVFKIYFSDRPIMCDDETLIDDYRRYNFEEMTKKRYREIKKRLKIKHDESFYDGNTLVRVVKISAKDIMAEDYYDNFIHRESEFYSDSEKRLMVREDRAKSVEYQDAFNGMNMTEKAEALEDFLELYGSEPSMKRELARAKDMLRSLEKGEECNISL